MRVSGREQVDKSKSSRVHKLEYAKRTDVNCMDTYSQLE